MIGNLLGVVVLAGLIVLFVLLVRRAWRSKRTVLKWIGVILGGLLTLIFTAVPWLRSSASSNSMYRTEILHRTLQ